MKPQPIAIVYGLVRWLVVGLGVTTGFAMSASAQTGTILGYRDLATGGSAATAASPVPILGIERLNGSVGRKAPGSRIAAHVLFVQGMGWNQREATEKFNLRLLRAIEEAYGKGDSLRWASRLCPDSSSDRAAPRVAQGGVLITVDSEWLSGDDPNLALGSTAVACMDRAVVDLGERGSITITRVQWDDLIYNTFQYPFVGYDDDLRNGVEAPVREGTQASAGYENLHGLRKPLNARLRNHIVAYGLSEAAVYLGPLGRHMREAVRAAMCIAADGAAGRPNALDELDRQHGAQVGASTIEVSVSSLEACSSDRADEPRSGFAIVAESLGARIVFDALVRAERVQATPPAQTDGFAPIPGFADLEVFLLGNPVPLFGPASLEPERLAKRQTPHKRLRLVALTEINDAFGFELVPYFEHQYVLRCWYAGALEVRRSRADDGCSTPIDSTHLVKRLSDFRGTATNRSRLVSDLGFDVTDVRLRFAKPLGIPGHDAADPVDAHAGYLAIDVVRKLLLCGTSDGRIRDHRAGCIAR